MSKTLETFYLEYKEWLDNGCPKHLTFKPYYGLCSSVSNIHDVEIMKNQFAEYGLDIKLPFNDDENHYKNERNNNSCHYNEKRIQWIKDRVNDIV